jgi:polysaccharide export outer membrane protein
MKKVFNSITRIVIGISILAIISSSCVPLRKTVYLQVKESADTVQNFVNERNIDYRIQPGDNLYIRVITLDAKTNILLNPLTAVGVGGGGQVGQNDAAIYLQSYEVSEAGYLDFPMIGEIFIRNMNVDEIQEAIRERLKEYLKELVVVVKLVNYDITILGEVRRPGRYTVYRANFNIFQAISIAGDMTDFANANRVAIIRQTKTGSTVHMVDMTRRSILASEFYYVKPYDIIFVYPVRGKQFTFANFPYGVVFGFISTTILLLNYLDQN